MVFCVSGVYFFPFAPRSPPLSVNDGGPLLIQIKIEFRSNLLMGTVTPVQNVPTPIPRRSQRIHSANSNSRAEGTTKRASPTIHPIVLACARVQTNFRTYLCTLLLLLKYHDIHVHTIILAVRHHTKSHASFLAQNLASLLINSLQLSRVLALRIGSMSLTICLFLVLIYTSVFLIFMTLYCSFLIMTVPLHNFYPYSYCSSFIYREYPESSTVLHSFYHYAYVFVGVLGRAPGHRREPLTVNINLPTFFTNLPTQRLLVPIYYTTKYKKIADQIQYRTVFATV